MLEGLHLSMERCFQPYFHKERDLGAQIPTQKYIRYYQITSQKHK